MAKKSGLSASSEDYLEAIYLVCQDKGAARSKDIMERLKVTGPSVTEALRMLSEKGLVNYAPYEAITLTKKGKVAAQKVLYRHVALRDFFIEVLGIDHDTADEGACKMEHVASSGIIERMIKYTEFLRHECPDQGCDKYECFEKYLKKVEESER
ncbi:MAG: DtxR family transcriptional regulator [Desulfobulbus propionicus]|nr:MAG: DtxR family transcriptional regulator [Desulfobulbus propionicus]